MSVLVCWIAFVLVIGDYEKYVWKSAQWKRMHHGKTDVVHSDFKRNVMRVEGVFKGCCCKGS